MLTPASALPKRLGGFGFRLTARQTDVAQAGLIEVPLMALSIGNEGSRTLIMLPGFQADPISATRSQISDLVPRS
jgi:hypothetical protein